MPRDPRYIPANSLQHIVDVVHQNRYLLSPSRELNRCFVGVLSLAQEKFDMTICAAVVLASHYHLLVRPRDGRHLADFMCYLKTNLAKRIGHRLRGVRGHFFARRYHASMVSDEEIAQARVLRYILSHGVKEGLVDTVRQWPGVHSAAASIEGKVLRAWGGDGRKGEGPRSDVRGGDDLEEEDGFVVLSPLPCWEHLPELAQRRAIGDMVEEIDSQAAALRRSTGTRSLGVEAVLAQDPYYVPENVEASPEPRFHAVDKEVLEGLVEAWRQVLAAFASASAALRSGDRNARFPEGTFPPALPFVPCTDVGGAASRGRGQPI